MYNGHKRVHGIKFQFIALPNGLIGNMYGPVEQALEVRGNRTPGINIFRLPPQYLNVNGLWVYEQTQWSFPPSEEKY